MKLITLYILLAFLANLVLPWWVIAVAGLFLGLFYKEHAGKAFGMGFAAMFLIWGAQALYIHLANDGILAEHIATMLNVGSPLLVVLITGLIGGLVGGLSVMTGSVIAATKDSAK